MALANSAPARAQAQAELPMHAQNAAPSAGPAHMLDLTSRADEDLRLLERAMRRTQAADPDEALSRTLDEIAAPVDFKLHAFTAEQLRRLPVMRLESLERHWRFDSERLTRWQADVRRAYTPYAASLAELAQRRPTWAALQGSSGPDGTSALVTERVQSMLTEFDTTERALTERLAGQLELARRANGVKSSILAGRSDVASAIADIDLGLRHLDAPPLWSARTWAPAARDPFNAMQQGLDVELRFAKAYSEAGTNNLHALRLFQLMLLPFVLWLFHRGRQVRAPPGRSAHEADSERVLSRPLSTWLLLAMTAVLALEPDAPLLVHEFALLMALVPVMRLLPLASRRLLNAWPYVTVALYVADQLGLVIASSGLLHRGYQLGLTVIGLALTLWLLWLLWRSRADHRSAPGSLASSVSKAGWVGAALLGLAACSNLVGNVTLAEMLTSGLIRSGYVGLLLYAGVTVSHALVRSVLQQPEVAERRLVQAHAAALSSFAVRAFTWGAALGWMVLTMDGFRVLRPVHAWLSDVLSHEVSVGEISISLRHVLVFVVSVFIAFWVARVVRGLLRDELQGHASLPRGVGNSVSSLTYYAILMAGLLVALSAAGFKVSQLAFLFGALGVGIGFGLQNIVNNFVSGLLLMFERPIQPGDAVEVAGVSGRVRQIGMRATIIRTFDGADVVVPNGTLLTANLTNWTLHDQSRRIEVEVAVAYGTDPARVLALLVDVAKATPGVAAEPAPAAQMKGYGNSSLDFVLRAWTHDFDRWTVTRSDLLIRVLQALNAAGITIPYNQYDVNVRTVPDQVGAVLRPPPNVPPLSCPAPTGAV